MLPKKERLTRNRFNALVSDKNLRTVYNPLGTLKFIFCSKGMSFSVVTRSRHEKKSVSRNKLRRRLYSLFKQSKISISGILYVSKQSYSFEFKNIKAYINDLFEKVKKNT